MTPASKSSPFRTAFPPAVIAALLLAGCSSGNIGESWQCPLAAGGSCDSVAAADPAVPDPKAAGTAVLAEPLWRVRDTGSALPAETAPARGPGRACAAECDGSFDPFGWLTRLFGTDAHDGEARPAGEPAQTPSATDMRLSDPVPGEEADASDEPTDPLPAEPGPSHAGPAPDDPAADDLRTGEVVARIWIAPFVDADGVYREASHVRVVLEPAGWRLK